MHFSSQKSYIRTDTYKNGKIDKMEVSFMWAPFLHPPGTTTPAKCDDVVESTLLFFVDASDYQVIYSRQCGCCDALCNGPQMNSQCNDEPVYDKTCYAGTNTKTPYLPGSNETVMIGCTAGQFCSVIFQLF